MNKKGWIPLFCGVLLWIPLHLVRADTLPLPPLLDHYNVGLLYQEKTQPSNILFSINPTWPDLTLNQGPRGGKRATPCSLVGKFTLSIWTVHTTAQISHIWMTEIWTWHKNHIEVIFFQQVTHENAAEMLSNECYRTGEWPLTTKYWNASNILGSKEREVVDILTYNHYNSQENKSVISQ
jgi:hypothetical protein